MTLRYDENDARDYPDPRVVIGGMEMTDKGTRGCLEAEMETVGTGERECPLGAGDDCSTKRAGRGVTGSVIGGGEMTGEGTRMFGSGRGC